MKKLILSFFCLLLTMTADAATNDISVDSIAIHGNRLAQLTQQVEVSMRNNAATVFEGRLYLLACDRSDGSLTPCLDTLVSITAFGRLTLMLYPVFPEGDLELRIASDADGEQVICTHDVTILPLRKLNMKATFSIDMLTDNGEQRTGTGADATWRTDATRRVPTGEAVLYGSRIKGWVRVTNCDADYYGARGGRGDDDGIVLWLEDRDSGGGLAQGLPLQHIANKLESNASEERTFAYDAVFRDGARYVLKAGYGMPYGLETIDSLCFTTRSGTNTYWTARGMVLPLPLSDEGHLMVPAEAVAVDLRGQQSVGGDLESVGGDLQSPTIDVSLANPNCLYYLDPSGNIPQGLDESRNLVRGQEAENISLSEGYDYYCPMAFHTQLVSYLMKPSYDNPDDEALGRGYSETIVLPFRPTHICLYDINGQTEVLHPDMLKVLRYYGYEADTLNVAALSSLSQMQAYKPYILGVYIGSRLLFTGENTLVPMTGEAIVRGGGIDFVGTTVGLRLSSMPGMSPLGRTERNTNYYVYSPADYSFHPGDADDVVAPFRACLYAADGKSHNGLNISKYVWGNSGKPGDSTAIDDIDHSTPATAHSVCDLQGRKVSAAANSVGGDLQSVGGDLQSPTTCSSLKKGIYITGGRKIVVK